jgi:hypothetical protein
MKQLIIALLFIPTLSSAQNKYSAYLFTYFTGNTGSEEAIRFAISSDGYHFRTLNDNQPVLSSQTISSTGGVRDPHIMRSKDGKTFYMVATDMVSAKGWSSNRGMVLLQSADLTHWTSSVVNIQTKYPGQEKLERVWAPETIYDDSAKKYLVYFSLKYIGEPDKICYAYVNPGFTDLEGEPRQLFYSPDSAACIDADIVSKGGRYFLFFKTEDRQPGIKVAVSDHLTRGYQLQSKDYVQQTKDAVEGACTFKLNDGSGYILMYDVYMAGSYQFTKTTDLKNFKVVDEHVDMNFHPRHGTVMPITSVEGSRLASEWLSPGPSLLSPLNKAIRQAGTAYDTASGVLTLVVASGTDLHKFDPQFVKYPGVSITTLGPRDFTKGAVTYTIRIGNRKKTYSVMVREK